MKSKLKRRILLQHHFKALALIVVMLLQSPAFGAGTGDNAPNKCSSSDINYLVTKIVSNGACVAITDKIQVDFDVEIWGNPTRYNLAVGYTNAGDSLLQEVTCLHTGIDIDTAGCSDYGGTGTTTNPFVTKSSFNLGCDLDGNLLVDPLVGVDFYVSFDANSGGTNAEITSPKCLLQEGTVFPTAPVKLQLLKVVTNDSGGSASATDWNLSAIQVGGTSSLNGVSGIASNSLPSGDYTLSESGASGYTLDSITCAGGTFDAASSVLTLAPEDSVTCTFNNNDDLVPQTKASLTLVKTVINNNGGNAIPDDFQLAIDGTQVLSGVATIVTAGVDLIISEEAFGSYSSGNWNCTDSTGLTSGLPTSGIASGTTVNLAGGATVICSIENDDIANNKEVDLSVQKSVSTTSPSIGDVITFTNYVENSGPDTATEVIVTDVIPAGFAYVANSISGGDIRVDADPSGVGLQWTIHSISAGASNNLTFQAIVLAP